MIILIFALTCAVVPFQAKARPEQPLEELTVNEQRLATVEVVTDQGKFEYHLDNSGGREVSAALQEIFNRTAAQKDVSATFTFLPGIYFIDAPITVSIVSLEIRGHGHAGQDIHGMNLKRGTIFQFGRNTGPNCITFHPTGHSKAFPSGESPWPHRNSKLGVYGMTFVGYNNTGVDTDKGYSRFRNDEPNFRGLHWYPAEGRYQDVEKEGQRALVMSGKGGKNEMLSINKCVFTDLYVGVEVSYCDVCFITDSWFAQMVYGIRVKGGVPGALIKNNLFADMETGVILGDAKFSTLNGNSFAYCSKCFTINKIINSTINDNVANGWVVSTGAGAVGAFCHIGRSEELVMNNNSVRWELTAHCKTRTIDKEPNGRAFVNIENSRNLMMANNVFSTRQTQTVVRLHNVSSSAITDNLITFAKGGNAVAQTGKCTNNFYRPIKPSESAPFDEFKE